MRIALRIVLLLVPVSGCDGEGALRQLTDVDISTPLPPGDAVGADLSGQYVLMSFDILECKCRRDAVSFCDSLRPVTLTTMVAQDGGSLTIDKVIKGQVYKNGDFKTAGRIQFVDPDTNLVAGGSFYVGHGRFGLDQNKRPTLYFAMDQTIAYTTSSRDYDCDYRSVTTWKK